MTDTHLQQINSINNSALTAQITITHHISQIPMHERLLGHNVQCLRFSDPRVAASYPQDLGLGFVSGGDEVPWDGVGGIGFGGDGVMVLEHFGGDVEVRW